MQDFKVYNNLINNIKKMPSISNKAAEKIALWFLSLEKEKVKIFLDAISLATFQVNKCKECSAIVEESLICDICLDSKRDETKLCILQNFKDLKKMEEINIFTGKYFILDVNFSQSNKNISEQDQIEINKLLEKISNFKIDEIIILLDFTIHGEFTSFYLKNLIKKDFPNIKIFRPAIGLPINSSIDYIDNESLEWSIKNKNEI